MSSEHTESDVAHSRGGLLPLAAAQLAIGAAAIFARFALAGGGPIAVSALRLSLAALPVVVVAAVRGAYNRSDRRIEWRLLAAGMALAVHFAAWIGSLRYASVAVSTLLVCTTPIWTELFALTRARRVRVDVSASVACALMGTTIVIGWPSAANTPLGMALALAGALAMAVYFLLVRECAGNYSTLAIVGRTYPLAALALGLASAATRDRIPSMTDGSAWSGVIAMAVISQLLGHTLLNAAVRRLSATFVATVTLLEPVVAAVLAALVFGERLSGGTFAGAALIFAGIGIAVRGEHPVRDTVTRAGPSTK